MVTLGTRPKFREVEIITIKEKGLEKHFVNLKDACQSLCGFAIQQSKAVKALRLVKHYAEIKHYVLFFVILQTTKLNYKKLSFSLAKFLFTIFAITLPFCKYFSFCFKLLSGKYHCTKTEVFH